jgi:hypothetical protein
MLIVGFALMKLADSSLITHWFHVGWSLHVFLNLVNPMQSGA